jgi:hypothetical protein
MSDVKRYDCNGRVRPMQENPEGPWVMHSDYTALRARLEAVEKERDEARKIADHDKSQWFEANARAERAEAALADARVAALVKALRYYKDQMCEGFCGDLPAKDTTYPGIDDDCSGCKARTALAAFDTGGKDE